MSVTAIIYIYYVVNLISICKYFKSVFYSLSVNNCLCLILKLCTSTVFRQLAACIDCRFLLVCVRPLVRFSALVLLLGNKLGIRHVQNASFLYLVSKVFLSDTWPKVEKS